jgi:hypothetical protein
MWRFGVTFTRSGRLQSADVNASWLTDDREPCVRVLKLSSDLVEYPDDLDSLRRGIMVVISKANFRDPDQISRALSRSFTMKLRNPRERGPDFRLIVLTARLYRINFAMQSNSVLSAVWPGRSAAWKPRAIGQPASMVSKRDKTFREFDAIDQPSLNASGRCVACINPTR